MRYYIIPPPANPVSRLITAAIAVLILTGAFFFGLAVLAVLVGAFSVFASIIYLRMWWFGRKNRTAPAPQSRTASDDTVIDAEYTVISKHRR